MHFFLYEWTTGGGLVEAPGGLPASLLGEGVAMVSALGSDLARIDGSCVTVLRDPRVLQFSLPGCEIVDIISSAAHHDEFERLAA
ncbi:MAG: hypothetical protein L0Z07_01760, partial [Planctomycetes bacterium]|nr:hypothetical protein [Planctomycetota bacterium]